MSVIESLELEVINVIKSILSTRKGRRAKYTKEQRRIRLSTVRTGKKRGPYKKRDKIMDKERPLMNKEEKRLRLSIIRTGKKRGPYRIKERKTLTTAEKANKRENLASARTGKLRGPYITTKVLTTLLNL